MIRRFLIAIGIAVSVCSYAVAQQLTLTAPSTIYPTVTFANLPAVATVATGAIYNVSDAGINGSLWRNNGTKWAPVNGSVVLMQSGMPWINLSSGSVSSVGAISGITALRYAYPKAWCYFPANALATTIAAGWYYCTFSTTSAGTAFLNQPSSTFPVVWPASPTAVTDGKGAYTSAATGNAILRTPTFTIPAGSMGINGMVVIESTVSHAGTTSSNLRMQLDGSDFNPSSVLLNSNTSAARYFQEFTNAGAAAANYNISQVLNNGSNTSSNLGLSTTDTGSSHTLGLGLQVVGATVDNIELNSVRAILYSDGQ